MARLLSTERRTLLFCRQHSSLPNLLPIVRKLFLYYSLHVYLQGIFTHCEASSFYYLAFFVTAYKLTLRFIHAYIIGFRNFPLHNFLLFFLLPLSFSAISFLLFILPPPRNGASAEEARDAQRGRDRDCAHGARCPARAEASRVASYC